MEIPKNDPRPKSPAALSFIVLFWIAQMGGKITCQSLAHWQRLVSIKADVPHVRKEKSNERYKAVNLTSKIEVSFAAPVLLPDDFQQRLIEMLSDVCKSYEAEHQDRVMWVFGVGGKLLWREPEEPDCDMSVLSIEVAERERYNDPS